MSEETVVVKIPNINKLITVVFHNGESAFCPPELIYIAVKNYVENHMKPTPSVPVGWKR